MTGALEGITVLEAGLLVQGPQAAALLAQLGADVTKVELPGFGDQSRWLPISMTDLRSAYYMGCNRGKRSITIDVRTPAGREVFLRLAERRRRRDHQLQAGHDGRVGPRLRGARGPQPGPRVRHRLGVRADRSRCRR